MKLNEMIEEVMNNQCAHDCSVEMADLKAMYESELADIDRSYGYELDVLVANMAEFVEMHQTKQKISEKLYALCQKIGGSDEQ